jgi:DNA-binding MarR family transcriptional regulator
MGKSISQPVNRKHLVAYLNSLSNRDARNFLASVEEEVKSVKIKRLIHRLYQLGEKEADIARTLKVTRSSISQHYSKREILNETP